MSNNRPPLNPVCPVVSTMLYKRVTFRIYDVKRSLLSEGVNHFSLVNPNLSVSCVIGRWKKPSKRYVICNNNIETIKGLEQISRNARSFDFSVLCLCYGNSSLWNNAYAISSVPVKLALNIFILKTSTNERKTHPSANRCHNCLTSAVTGLEWELISFLHQTDERQIENSANSNRYVTGGCRLEHYWGKSKEKLLKERIMFSIRLKSHKLQNCNKQQTVNAHFWLTWNDREWQK